MIERKSPFRKLGDEAEAKARVYLERKGYKWICSRFQTRWGEIDLVMEKKNSLVFVEVKYRSGWQYGGPEEAITKGKKDHMIKTALDYVARTQSDGKMMQFDVLTFSPSGVKHYPNAFWAGSQYYY